MLRTTILPTQFVWTASILTFATSAYAQVEFTQFSAENRTSVDVNAVSGEEDSSGSVFTFLREDFPVNSTNPANASAGGVNGNTTSEVTATFTEDAAMMTWSGTYEGDRKSVV